MAASIATRDFLIAEDSDSIHQSSPASGFPHLVTLLPPMCLNRYISIPPMCTSPILCTSPMYKSYIQVLCTSPMKGKKFMLNKKAM